MGLGDAWIPAITRGNTGCRTDFTHIGDYTGIIEVPALRVLFSLIIVWLRPAEDPAAPTPETPPVDQPTAVVDTPLQGVQFFTTTPYLIYPDNADNRTPPPLYKTFLDDIAAAKSTIDIAVFDMDLPELGQALLDAHNRGVTVRVAFDDENLEDARVSILS